jgi:hypothetical protein
MYDEKFCIIVVLAYFDEARGDRFISRAALGYWRLLQALLAFPLARRTLRRHGQVRPGRRHPGDRRMASALLELREDEAHHEADSVE